MILLVLAALDVSGPLLDRTGMVLLGLALWAVADPLGGPRVRRPARMSLPPKRAELEPDGDEPIAGLADRIGAFSFTGRNGP